MSANGLDPRARLVELRDAYQMGFRRPAFWVALLGLLVAVGLGALIARGGSPLLRGLGGGLLLLALLVLLIFAVLSSQRARDVERGALLAVGALDRGESARLRRALRLGESHRTGPSSAAVTSSSELAGLHLAQVLDGVSREGVKRAGKARGRKLSFAALLLLVGAVWLGLFALISVVEGLDVLLARRGTGPFPIAYVAEREVSRELPAYLRSGNQAEVITGDAVTLPEGSTLIYRILPTVPGRRFVLTDGHRNEPFVSDGRGALVARVAVEDPGSYRVAAQFGEVLLMDLGALEVATAVDREPLVKLEGAPRMIPLEEFSSLELSYEVYDDFGLGAVDLVVESGSRQERAELVRLDGDRRIYRGGYSIDRSHPLLQDPFASVIVTIQARDRKSSGGPRWGKSAPITIAPSALGQSLVSRHQALRAFRSALTHYLAADVAAARLTAHQAARHRADALLELTRSLQELTDGLTQGGSVPAGSLLFLRTQVEALGKEPRVPERAEAVLLAADVLIADLSAHDAKGLAVSLAGVLDEFQVMVRSAGEGAEAKATGAAAALLDAAESGAASLREVGELGLDLGSVARGDLARIRRALTEGAAERAEAGARHLSARLRRGTPSFGSKGGGVESGMGRSSSGSSGSGSGGPGGDGEPSTSEAPSDYDKLVDELESLAGQHEAQVDELQALLDEARRALARDTSQSADLREATERLREALAGLPELGAGPGTAASEAAQGRSHGEAMADALEAGRTVESKKRADSAMGSFERALKLLEERGGFVDHERLLEAKEAVSAARNAAEQAEHQQGSRGSPSLAERALRERALADALSELSQRARQGEAPLPGATLESIERAREGMQQAASALERGDGQRGAELAERAQEELLKSQPERAKGSSGGPGKEDNPTGHVDVPGEEGARAKDFLQRVDRGLGRSSGGLAGAVRRYAEKLK